MTGKKFSVISIGITLLLLLAFALPTIIIDPYFHYHKPLEGLYYPMDNQRYQNDGMLKNFSYDSIIIGTSMALNFDPEEFNELFDANALHVCFLGGSYKEINENVLTGLEHNPNVRIVVRGLDITSLHRDKDYMKYDSYPTYLYDDNPFNDVSYVFNKGIFDISLSILQNDQPIEKEEVDLSVYSKEHVLSSYERKPLAEEIAEFTEEDKENILANIRQNVTDTAEKYPDVAFYLFITPYSICYWDEVNREGRLEYMIDAEKAAIEEMLKYENIHLFSFAGNTEMICDLDNYMDQGHYSPMINSEMLVWMKNGEYELTRDNYEKYIEDMRTFLTTYDFETIYQ